ncbi:MAG: hypothetical protein RLZZ283_771 [Candidatus Parcubacteria bacterium]|jgi:hypothetical protein
MNPFAASLDANGIVQMKLSGSLTEENKEALLVAIEETKKLVRDTAAAQQHKVRVLFDLTDFTGTYNVGAMMAMKEMADANRPHTLKTAIFGGSSMA